MVRSKSFLLPRCLDDCCPLREDALELCLELALEGGLEDCLELARLLPPVFEAVLPPRPPAPLLSELVLLRGDMPAVGMVESSHHYSVGWSRVGCSPCLGVLEVDLIRSMSPTSMAFGVVGVVER